MTTSSRSVGKIFIYVALILFAIINLYPILWMVINSFKTEQFSLNKLGFPKVLQFHNYVDAWHTANFGQFSFSISVVVSVVAVIITVLFGALAALFIVQILILNLVD